MIKNIVTLGFWAPGEGSVSEPPHMSPGFFGSFQNLPRFEAFWKVLIHVVRRNPTHFCFKNTPCFRNPTQLASKNMPCYAKPKVICCKENAVFSETQRKSLRGKRGIFRNPTQIASRKTSRFQKLNEAFLKISFKNLEFSEDLEMSQKNPGSYGAVKKLPKPENPTQITTYYGQKSSDTR